jgi:DNA-binding GntR family transcriptional regulator
MVVYKLRERQRIIAQHERLFEAIRDGKASLAAKYSLSRCPESSLRC